MSVNHPDIFIRVSLNTEIRIPSRTNRPYAKAPNSNIYEHFLETDHGIDSSNFNIIFPANDTSIKVAQSILIQKLTPSLSVTMYSTPLHIEG